MGKVPWLQVAGQHRMKPPAVRVPSISNHKSWKRPEPQLAQSKLSTKRRAVRRKQPCQTQNQSLRNNINRPFLKMVKPINSQGISKYMKQTLFLYTRVKVQQDWENILILSSFNWKNIVNKKSNFLKKCKKTLLKPKRRRRFRKMRLKKPYYQELRILPLQIQMRILEQMFCLRKFRFR